MVYQVGIGLAYWYYCSSSSHEALKVPLFSMHAATGLYRMHRDAIGLLQGDPAISGRAACRNSSSIQSAAMLQTGRNKGT
jgi:hypothetical protein